MGLSGLFGEPSLGVVVPLCLPAVSRSLVALSFGVVLLVGALGAVALRVVSLERAELEHESDWVSLGALATQAGGTRVSARLTSLTLRPGDRALFELCAQDPLSDRAWIDAFEVVVWQPEIQKVGLKVPLDAAHLALVKRRGERACLSLGGGSVEREGMFAFDLVWVGRARPSGLVGRVPLRARVLATHALGLREGLLIGCAALGALLCIFSAFGPGGHSKPASRRTGGWALAGTALAVLLAAGLLRLPLPGSIGGLVRGTSLAAVEVVVALVCARYVMRPLRDQLGLYAPAQQPVRWLVAAVLTALALRPIARWAMRVVPQTSEAPLEAFVSWPSGALAFAALGMVVPLAEELFFRGFVFGALRPLGLRIAYAGSLALFAAAHVQQLWGDFGALLSVLITGAALTALRAWSGSTLVSALAHVLYNLSLWRDSFFA